MVLSAFLDESDQGDPSVFTVAGYVYTPTSSEAFREQWELALKKAPVPLQRFHMSEFEAEKGSYAGWERVIRHEFLHGLLGIRLMAPDPVIWADSKVACQLQAADILAFECCKIGLREFGRKQAPPRSRVSAEMLLATSGPLTQLHMIGAESLQRMVTRARSGGPLLKTS